MLVVLLVNLVERESHILLKGYDFPPKHASIAKILQNISKIATYRFNAKIHGHQTERRTYVPNSMDLTDAPRYHVSGLACKPWFVWLFHRQNIFFIFLNASFWTISFFFFFWKEFKRNFSFNKLTQFENLPTTISNNNC